MNERRLLTQLSPGARVVVGTEVRTLERWSTSPSGQLYFAHWNETDAPVRYQGDPWLTIIPPGRMP
ncbi:MAG: hypothetical protein HOQ07_08675 [Sinomonas sp.]|nr:hypothetical protein [Sinomonas sp.]